MIGSLIIGAWDLRKAREREPRSEFMNAMRFGGKVYCGAIRSSGLKAVPAIPLLIVVLLANTVAVWTARAQSSTDSQQPPPAQREPRGPQRSRAPTPPSLAPGETRSTFGRPPSPPPRTEAADKPSETEIRASTKLMQAQALTTQNDIDGALAAYDEAIALRPPQEMLALTLWMRGMLRKLAKHDLDGALSDFSEAIGVHRGGPGDHDAQLALKSRAEVWMAKQTYDRAIADLSAAIVDNADKNCRGAINPEECRKRLVIPNESSYLALRGEAWMYKADMTRALADLERALALDGNNVEAYVTRARVHASRVDFSSALRDIDHAIALNPTNVSAHFYRGITHKLLRQWDDAVADLEKVLALQPGHLAAQEQLDELRKERMQVR